MVNEWGIDIYEVPHNPPSTNLNYSLNILMRKLISLRNSV